MLGGLFADHDRGVPRRGCGLVRPGGHGPLIVAALVSTQLVPLIGWATARGVARGLAIAASLLGVVAIAAGLDALVVRATRCSATWGASVQDISDGADQVVAWLRDNNDWVKQHEEAIRDFLKSLLPAAKDAAGGMCRGA